VRRDVIERTLCLFALVAVVAVFVFLLAVLSAPLAGAGGDVCARKPWKPECTTTTTEPAPTTTSTTVAATSTTLPAPTTTTTVATSTSTTWITVDEPCQTCDHELPAPEVQVHPDPTSRRLPVTGGNLARALVGVAALVAGGVALWVSRSDDGGDR